MRRHVRKPKQILRCGRRADTRNWRCDHLALGNGAGAWPAAAARLWGSATVLRPPDAFRFPMRGV